MQVEYQVNPESQEWGTQSHWVRLGLWLLSGGIDGCLYWLAQTYDDNVHPDSGRCLVRGQKMCAHRTRKRHCGSLAPSENEHHFFLTSIYVRKFWRPAPWSSWRRPPKNDWFCGAGWPSGWTSPPCPPWCWCTCLVKAPLKRDFHCIFVLMIHGWIQVVYWIYLKSTTLCANNEETILPFCDHHLQIWWKKITFTLESLSLAQLTSASSSHSSW